MKILILAPFTDLKSTIWGLTEGLEECGYKWDQVDTHSVQARNTRASTYADIVARKAEGCDTVLIGKGATIPIGTYQLMVEKCPDTTYLTFDSVSGNGCGPPSRPFELGPRGMMCDRIILTGTEGARWFRENGYEGRIAQIYQGCRHRIWSPGEYPRENPKRIAFLGSSTYKGDGGRREKLRAIAQAKHQLYNSKRIFHEYASKLYWNSAICINFCCGDITSNRVMRVMASGGFCLTERNADIDHSFTNRVELATFEIRDIEHMLDRIKYYLGKPELRNEIAMRGYEWTRNKSWTEQAEKMVKFIQGKYVPADGAAEEYVSNQNSTD